MGTLGRAQLYIYMGTFTLDDSNSSSLSVGYTSAMVNISILQSEDDNTSPTIALPDSFIALKNTSTTSELFLQVVGRFLEDKERKTLGRLRGQAAAEVADFLDEVRKLIVTTTLSCGKLGSL